MRAIKGMPSRGTGEWWWWMLHLCGRTEIHLIVDADTPNRERRAHMRRCGVCRYMAMALDAVHQRHAAAVRQEHKEAT